MRKKGFTLIELLVVLAIVAVLLGFVGTCVLGIFSSDSPVTRTTGQSPYEDKLRSASKIEVKEKVISIGKHYDLYVDGEKVAEVTGKAIEILGDVFTLKTVDGKVLASEKESKRFLRLSRAAICYDGDGSVTGYIGEEKLKDLFSWSYVFHFYDANKKEIGKSKKLGKSSLGRHKLYDNQGNADYDIDKRFRAVGLVTSADKYILTRIDFESSIPLEYAIFITCIEDAIADAN